MGADDRNGGTKGGGLLPKCHAFLPADGFVSTISATGIGALKDNEKLSGRNGIGALEGS